MQALDDMALLREFAERHSETAFEGLVNRRIGFVYSAALRQVREPYLAQEVTQAVFIILAQKAAKISDKTILSGWLFRTTRFTALAQIRTAARRRRQEKEVQMQTEFQGQLSTTAANPVWEQMSPLLDEALAVLTEKDRQAILLRFFENKSLAEVGNSLGMGEDTARKRVSRALEKLRRYLNRRGIFSTTAIIAGEISANSVHAAPVGLAKTISTMALAKGAAAGTGVILSFLKLITMTKLQTAIIGAIVVAGVATPLVIQHQAKLREENESLRRQIAHLKADNEGLANQVAQLRSVRVAPSSIPGGVASVATNPPVKALSFQQVADFITSHRELPRAQIEAYLTQNHRDTESLLAAFHVSHDPAYLREAATNSPNDPAVQFAVLANNVFPGQQHKWIDAFKASSPNNALPWYLSALDYFNSNQPDQAIQELAQATQRQIYSDYSGQSAQAVEEMYNQAGWPALAAKAGADMTTESVSYLNVLKSLANNAVQMQRQYSDQGYSQSSLAMATMGVELADQLRNGYGPIDQLVGIGIEKKILAQLDPTANYDFLGGSVSQVQAELDHQKQTISQLLQFRDQVRPTLNESELNDYWEREKIYGEMYAMQWLQSKYQGTAR